MIHAARSLPRIDSLRSASPRGGGAAGERSSARDGPSVNTQLLLVYAAILATAAASVFAGCLTWGFVAEAVRQRSVWAAVPPLFSFAVAMALFYGNLVHQIASAGHLRVRRNGHAQPRDPLDLISEGNASSTVILVPSYKENLHIVRQTLLSAALQEYPNLRVVLLIDDPPFPSDPKDMRALVGARRLTGDLQLLLARQAAKLRAAKDELQQRAAAGSVDRAEETLKLSRLFRDVATWFLKQAAEVEVDDHMDRMFVDDILLRRARSHAERAERLKHLAGVGGHGLSVNELLREYQRLNSLFSVEFTHWERKRFINLSHELNKAMNLNGYIGLIGRSLRCVTRNEGIELCDSSAEEADFVVPDAKYVIVVDADSLLMPGYVSHLIHKMERPENRRMAVAQSPYLSFPNPPGLLERTAAATVAAQYVVHLGFHQHEAIYWVGANAVLRKEALDDIREPVRERGYTIFKYIQDRTHIEDTESTIDLVERGWTLHNSSAPLAYSATPADFGSLLIQRRRWANGGLIVLPKLLRYLSFGKRVPQRFLQGILRVSYLLNLSLGSVAVLLTLLVPLPGRLIPCLAVAGLCYAFVYGADMLRMGFRLRDLPHVYALNLMLIPVNLGGVAKSLVQAWTGRKTPFARTPKTKGRTWIPPLYIAAEYGLLAFCLFTSIMAFTHGRMGHAIWALMNALVFTHIVANLLWDEAPDPAGLTPGQVSDGGSGLSR